MKGYKGLSILCAVLLFGVVIVSPAIADRKGLANDKKIDEAGTGPGECLLDSDIRQKTDCRH